MYINPSCALSQVVALSASPTRWLLVQVSRPHPWWFFMLTAIREEVHPRGASLGLGH